jgi:hypothetical protein
MSWGAGAKDSEESTQGPIQLPHWVILMRDETQLSNPQSLNLYSYALNSPLVNTDPTQKSSDVPRLRP